MGNRLRVKPRRPLYLCWPVLRARVTRGLNVERYAATSRWLERLWFHA